VYGGAGNDFVAGGDGDDSLFGGTGKDFCAQEPGGLVFLCQD
jgi:hypothetical protein